MNQTSTCQSAPSQPQPSRRQLRQLIRQRRRELTEEEQQWASIALVDRFREQPDLSHAKTIALYLSIDGELDSAPLIHWLWQQKKRVYIPVLHPFSQGQLLFLHYHADSQMVVNRYGILEPRLNVREICPVAELDLLCTPLVAFDSHGNRLGMGGGFYDRTLATFPRLPNAPQILGIAHDCQRVERVPTEHWDQPLPQLLTPSHYWNWQAG